MPKAGKSIGYLCARNDGSYSGVIERLELTNFMCHANLALDFNPHVNFIVGKNGCGKSAIMTGVMTVLGIRAADTARGKSQSNFVRFGCAQAKIKIFFLNSGHCSFKPEKYGPKIIITRVLNARGGSRITVGLASGGTATCSKNELTEILQALNIILPNPFALLTQETMKTFLSNKKPTEMYSLVENGTGIKIMKQGIASLRDQLASLGHKEQSMVQLLSNMEAELKSWKAKEKQLKKADEAQTLLEQLELESVWVDVHELEKELRELEKDLKDTTKAKDGVSSNIEKWRERQAQLREQMSIQAEDGTNARNLYNAKKFEKDELQNNHGNIQKEIDKCNSQLRAISRQLRTYAEEKKVLQEEIGKIANHSVDEEMMRRLEQQQQMEKNKEELVSVKSSNSNVGNKLEEQRQHFRNIEQELANARSYLNNCANQAKECSMEIERTKREASSIPSAYGPRMAAFKAEIDKAASRGVFKQKPIGPIGLEVKLKDYSWSLAIENYLKGEMRTFFCDNFEDSKKLDEMAKRILGTRVSCVVSRFFDRPFDVSSKRAIPSDGLLSLLDVLDIADPRVLNYLIDQRRVESVLLCSETTKAFNMMQRQERVPQRCSIMLTKDAEQVFPAPNFKVYGKESDVDFLVKSHEASVAGLENRLKEAEANRNSAKIEVRDMEARLSGVREELSTLTNQRNKLQKQMEQLQNAIREAENEQFLGTGDNFETLQEELREMEKNAELKEEEKLQIKDLIAEQEELKQIAHLQLLNMAAEFQVLNEKCMEAENSKQEHKNKLDSLDAKIESSKRKQNEHLHNQQKGEKLVEKKQTEINAAMEKANSVGPRVDSRRLKAHIQRDIDRHRNAIQNMHSKLEAPEVIEENVSKFTSRVAEESTKVELVSRKLAEMDVVMSERRRFYSSQVITTFSFIRAYFGNLFESQPMTGDLDVNFTKSTLSIMTKFKGANKEGAGNLSGGERSFTTVALVMAVWSKLLIPFYMLDEFDVFMDMANRRRAMDMLLAEAKARGSHQFIFFTPQEMNLKADSTITIHKLTDPRST